MVIKNAFDTHDGVPETLCKHHQSKDMTFLHRNCIRKIFSTPTKKKKSSTQRKKNEQKKIEKKSDKSTFDFSEKCSDFFCSNCFSLGWRKFFLELRNFFEYSFDAEKSYLSIGDVYRVFPALHHGCRIRFWWPFFQFFFSMVF